MWGKAGTLRGVQLWGGSEDVVLWGPQCSRSHYHIIPTASNGLLLALFLQLLSETRVTLIILGATNTQQRPCMLVRCKRPQ